MIVKEDIIKLILRHFIMRDRIHTYSTIKNQTIVSACLRLDRRIQQKYILEGYKQAINCISSLQNGNLISGSADAIIRIWSFNGYYCLTELKGHYNSITALLTIPNFYFASGSKDCNIRIWTYKYNTYHTKNILRDHDGIVTCLLYLDNGYLVSASSDKTIRVWNTNEQYKCIKTVSFHYRSINDLILLRNEKFASASDDWTIKVWNANNFEYIMTIKAHKKVTCMLPLRDGNLAAGCGNDIKLWEGNKNFMCFKVLRGYSGLVRALVLLANDNIVSAASNVINIWTSRNEYSLIRSFKAHDNIIQSLYLLENDDFVSCSNDEMIKVWGIDEN
jgi:WD40 repeat protein